MDEAAFAAVVLAVKLPNYPQLIIPTTLSVARYGITLADT
jgi:hypothetical protein